MSTRDVEGHTVTLDVLDSLAMVLRAGAKLECKTDGFFLLHGPDDHMGAGGNTIGAAVVGYIETIVHREYLRRMKDPATETVWEVGDRVTRNEHGPVMRGEITATGHNLYTVLWDDAIREIAYPRHDHGLSAEGNT